MGVSGPDRFSSAAARSEGRPRQRGRWTRSAHGVREDPLAIVTRVSRVEQVANEYVTTFNDAVASGDFGRLLARLHHRAVVRFENVPGVGVLEFIGRAAYTAAYEQQPPDDQIDVVGPVRTESGVVVIPFAWRRDGAPGLLRLTIRHGRITQLVASFG